VTNPALVAWAGDILSRKREGPFFKIIFSFPPRYKKEEKWITINDKNLLTLDYVRAIISLPVTIPAMIPGVSTRHSPQFNMRSKKRAITIQDVAKAAGVSVSTVSRVLNEKDDVASDTQDRILAVIAELDYTSNLAARSMRSRRNHVIGLIMPDVASPYCIEVMNGVNRAIALLDYHLIVYTNGDVRKYGTADQERQYVGLLNGSITDGVIVVTPEATDFATDAPVVVIDPNKESQSHPAVIATNRAGAMAVMSYLIGLGHRRIAHITGRLELVSAQRRLQGYKDGLAAANIPLDEELIRVSDYTIETAAECTRALLSLDNPPTAVFAANDMSAMGVYQTAKDAGIRIPQDLSVVGFDNLHESTYLNPPLTTVDQFLSEMGAIATEMVVRLVKGENLERNIHRIQTKLVIRESCHAVE
jgi:LacI family transcriptional regulator